MLNREKMIEIYEKNYLYFKTKDSEKAVFWGIKFLSKMQDLKSLTSAELEILLNDFEYIEAILSNITYNQFINLFPIIKDYDGEKWQCKDYFSTKEFLQKYDLNDFIKDKDELFWNYYNHDVMNFGVRKILVFEEILKRKHLPGLLETFLKEISK